MFLSHLSTQISFHHCIMCMGPLESVLLYYLNYFCPCLRLTLSLCTRFYPFSSVQWQCCNNFPLFHCHPDFFLLLLLFFLAIQILIYPKGTHCFLFQMFYLPDPFYSKIKQLSTLFPSFLIRRLPHSSTENVLVKGTNIFWGNKFNFSSGSSYHWSFVRLNITKSLSSLVFQEAAFILFLTTVIVPS